MTNTAIINRIENNEIFLVHIKDFGKKEETEREFWKIKNQEFKAFNPENLILEHGDAVEYYIPEGKTIAASFFVLIFPLVSFLATFGILTLIGFKSEKLIALISVAVMILSFSINKIFSKLGIKETLPAIVKKVSKESLKLIQSECKDCGSCTVCK